MHLKPKLNADLIGDLNDEVKIKFKKNVFKVNENDELVDENLLAKSRIESRNELKKNAKILKSDLLKEIENDAEDFPREISHSRTKQNRHLEGIQEIEERQFARRRITNKEKKQMNLKRSQMEDDFNDFRDMNDLKGIFDRNDRKKIKRN